MFKVHNLTLGLRLTNDKGKALSFVTKKIRYVVK